MDSKGYIAHQKINLEGYNVQELAGLKKKVEDDIKTILDSYNGFKFLHKKFEEAKVLIKNVSEQKSDDTQILIPLSNSLFIPGKITSTDKFIVDIGTGYYAERNALQAMQHCDQTLEVIKTNGDKMVKEINSKQEIRDKINVEVQKRLAQKSNQPSSESFKKK